MTSTGAALKVPGMIFCSWQHLFERGEKIESNRIEFYLKLDKNEAKTLEMLQKAYDDEAKLSCRIRYFGKIGSPSMTMHRLVVQLENQEGRVQR